MLKFNWTNCRDYTLSELPGVSLFPVKQQHRDGAD